MSRLSLLLKGSLLQTVEAIVSIVVGFITLPLMMSFLGAEKYGVWILVGGFAGLLYIFDLGFASSVTRGVAASIARRDDIKTNNIVNSALVIYTSLAVLIALCVGILAFLYDPGSDSVISQSELTWVIALVGFSIAIEFPFKAFAGLTSAHLRYDLIAAYKITIKLISTGCLLYLLYAGYELIAIAWLQVITGLVSNITFFLIARNTFKNLQVSIKLIKRETFAELFSYSSWAFVIDLNRLLKERVDLFFVGAFISLGAVSIYYVSVRIVEYSLQLLYKSLNLALPILTGDHSKGDSESFAKNLLLVNRAYMYCSVLTLIFYIVWGETIFYYWMGSDFAHHEAYSILLILLGGRLAAFSSQGFNTALYASAKHKLLAWFNILETIATTILLALLLGGFGQGVISAALAIAMPLIISRMLFLPLIASYHMEIENPKKILTLSFRPLGLAIAALLAQLIIPIKATFSLNHLLLSGVMVILIVLFCALDLLPRERALIVRLLSPLRKKISSI
jgi:O-antigen/teichoic acid export membrane protein